VCLEFGAGDGGEPVGQSPSGDEIRADPGALAAAPEAGHEATLRRLVEEWCDLGREGTDPAAVLVQEALPERLYREAVTGVVDPASTERLLETLEGARWFALGDGRGIVGAAAAAAYPARNTTFELVAYRERHRWGTARAVSFESVDEVDTHFPETFNNIDRDNGHVALAPATPCPVLIGVRGFVAPRLLEAAREVDTGEPWAGHLLFESNQGTDDHIVESEVHAAAPLTTVRVRGTVAGRPRRVQGGHVIFPLRSPGGAIDCAAYEPTKGFRAVVERLAPGDQVRAQGAVRADGATLNLEKLEIVEPVARLAAAQRPACPTCGTRLKSGGRKGPLRCRHCGSTQTRRGPDTEPGPRPGWYEVPVSARRHLARPLDPHGGRFSK
jgi:tRNA(Ile2)-agmatinylcytidine synthase